jgi:hypothetical protein
VTAEERLFREVLIRSLDAATRSLRRAISDGRDGTAQVMRAVVRMLAEHHLAPRTDPRWRGLLERAEVLERVEVGNVVPFPSAPAHICAELITDSWRRLRGVAIEDLCVPEPLAIPAAQEVRP